MQRQSLVTFVGLTGLILVGLAGCGIWPVMTEEDGRRPFAMGKSDQVLLPWAPHPVHLHENYGVPYRQALENQILNPTAARNTDPVPGAADSRALQNSLTRYQLMFQNPPFSEFRMTGGASAGTPPAGTGGTTK